jgi:hypothetical protein
LFLSQTRYALLWRSSLTSPVDLVAAFRDFPFVTKPFSSSLLTNPDKLAQVFLKINGCISLMSASSRLCKLWHYLSHLPICFFRMDFVTSPNTSTTLVRPWDTTVAMVFMQSVPLLVKRLQTLWSWLKPYIPMSLVCQDHACK